MGLRVLLAAALQLCMLSVYAYQDGDFIATARKAQFHEQRSHWHDLLAHHCPRFGHDRLVAVPLPKPQLALKETDEYKLQLGFDGDRHTTGWLKVLGSGTPAVPVIEVELRSSGGDLLGVKAWVAEAPVSYQHMHRELVQEFKNVTRWPKHLLVRYHFDIQNEVDLNRGLVVLFFAGLLSCLIMALSAVAGAEHKVAAFLTEVTAEGPESSGRQAAKTVAKAE